MNSATAITMQWKREVTRTAITYVAFAAAAIVSLTMCRGCCAATWSQRGTVGIGVLIPGGGFAVLTADNTHGVWCAYWSDVKRGLPDIAITAEGTQVSPDGRKAKFCSVEPTE